MTGHAARALGLGLVLAALSELAFYPVAPGAHVAWLVAFYAVAALAASLVAAARPPGGWAGPVLLAGLAGFLVEGVPVAQLYEAPPFSILWTPLAWHALVSLGAGVWLWRWATARGWAAGAGVALGLGALLGIWGGWAWANLEGDGGTYRAQVALAAAMLAAGHVALGLAPPAPPAPRALAGVAALLALAWGGTWAAPLFPASLILPALAAATWWALGRLPRGDALSAIRRPVPPARHALAALIPCAAIPVAALVPRGAEVNAWWILLAGPVAGAAWLAALGAALAKGRRSG